MSLDFYEFKSLLLLLSHFSHVRLCVIPRWQPTRFPHPWDSPGKNTGVGCHFLLQCMKVKSLSRVRLLATPWTAAHQAPPSIRFSRQEYWSGLPFPSPMHESEVAQSYPTLLDPMDCSPPGSSVHGIFQARVLEWGAIAFSRVIITIFLNSIYACILRIN